MRENVILRSGDSTPRDVTVFSNKHRLNNSYCMSDGAKHYINRSKLFINIDLILIAGNKNEL